MNRLAAVVLACAAFAACDNKAKPKDTGGTGSAPAGTPGSAAAKPTDDMKPEPVGKDPGLPAQPRPDPTPAADVRPPTAADLAEYTKDLPGSGSKLMAKIETSLGTLNCELYGDKAPMTVANFVGLATGKKAWMNPKLNKVERGTPYFDGITFHRVIPGFMIQGGDPLGAGYGGPGYNFDDEIWDGQQIKPGVLAMANAGVRGGRGTNGSQFFVMEGRREDLDRKHTVFGECKELDVLKKISGVERDRGDKPLTPVTINKLTITKG
jgi:peptidyl-prolyl cis-trans isomerase A (cyclophilin A)